MEIGNIFDIGIKAVKTSGVTNMVGKKNVEYYSFMLGFTELYFLLEDMSLEEYMWYIESIDYDSTPRMDFSDIEYCLELKSSDESKQIINDIFPEKFSSYHKELKNMGLKQIPCSGLEYIEEISKKSEPLVNFISNRVQDHVFNYLLPLNGGCVVLWFNDSFYKYKKNKIEMLTGEDWLEFQRLENRLKGVNKKKFTDVDEQMRLAALLVQ